MNPWQLDPGETVITYQDVQTSKFGKAWLNVSYIQAGGVFASEMDTSYEFRGAIDLAVAYGDGEYAAHLEQKRHSHSAIVTQYAASHRTLVATATATGTGDPRGGSAIHGYLDLTIMCVGTPATVQTSSALALREVIGRPQAAASSQPERTTSLTSFTPGSATQQWFIVPVVTGEPDQFMIINRSTGQPLDYLTQEGPFDRLILYSRVAVFAPAQRWTIEWLNAGHTLARFTNYHTKKAIDFVGFDLERPPGMLIPVVEGAPAQKWYVDAQPDGAVVLRNYYNNKVLDFP